MAQQLHDIARHIALCLLAVLATAGLSACGGGKDKAAQFDTQRLGHITTELDPAPRDDAEPARAKGNFTPIPQDAAWFPIAQRGQKGCYRSVVTAIRAQKGNNCVIGDPNQAKAEIGGWSETCTQNCDTPARLREVNAAAAGECRAYCAQFQCGAQFSPSAQCGASECANGARECNAQWPKFNSCYLLQAASVWNCECMPAVEG